ncbi:hypothetical protein INT80_10060 [Gallibacterium anatis]|uniref:Uncharacterized protein n=1 Tax=Gallibacterium anatis TaxID=750 RepID=A0A930UXZ1_9PAST|nr:hypothetical protein [Gallibacterium anatis]
MQAAEIPTDRCRQYLIKTTVVVVLLAFASSFFLTFYLSAQEYSQSFDGSIQEILYFFHQNA